VNELRDIALSASESFAARALSYLEPDPNLAAWVAEELAAAELVTPKQRQMAARDAKFRDIANRFYDGMTSRRQGTLMEIDLTRRAACYGKPSDEKQLALQEILDICGGTPPEARQIANIISGFRTPTQAE
jgi:hypothetical protein